MTTSVDTSMDVKNAQRYSTKRKRDCNNCVKLDRYGMTCRVGLFPVAKNGCCDLHTLDLKWLNAKGHELHGPYKKNDKRGEL